MKGVGDLGTRLRRGRVLVFEVLDDLEGGSTQGIRDDADVPTV